MRWRGVNRVHEGTLTAETRPGEWLVQMPEGKYMVVDERSFIYG